MNPKCSICDCFVSEEYCREDGNEKVGMVNATEAGIDYLVNAYRLVDARYKDPTAQDYEQSRHWFEKALQYEDSFPAVVRMVTWFQYAMRIVQMVGGGPLTKVQTNDLREFMRALQHAQKILDTLAADIRRTIQVSDPYEYMIRANLSEARKVLEARS